MPDAADTRTMVLDTLVAVLGISHERAETAELGVTEEWDSLQHIEVVFQLEDSTGVRFSEGELSELTTAARIIDALSAHRGA